eukprot:4704932-Amphidinium_carterae.1
MVSPQMLMIAGTIDQSGRRTRLEYSLRALRVVSAIPVYSSYSVSMAATAEMAARSAQNEIRQNVNTTCVATSELVIAIQLYA